MCVAFCIIASMSAWEGMRYASGSIILLNNLMSTIVHPFCVLSALVVYLTKHGYVNGMNPFHSMHLCSWSLSNSVLIISRSFGPFGRSTVVRVSFPRLGLTFCAICTILLTVLGLVLLSYAMRSHIVERWGLVGAVPLVSVCA